MSFALCYCRGGGPFENGSTARIGRGTGSQESEFLISFFLFLLVALTKGCESFSSQPVVPCSYNTSRQVLSAEAPVLVVVSVMSL